MKNILILIICIALLQPVFAQVQDEPLFGTSFNPVAFDTIDTQTDTLYSRPIIFADLNNVGGALSISGYIKRLSGTDTTFTCQLRMITDVSEGTYDYDIWRNLGTISLKDSTRYMFDVGSLSWWTVCHGYQVRFIPSFLSGTFKVKARGLSK